MYNTRQEAIALIRIMIDVHNDTQAGVVLSRVQDLDFVKTVVGEEKVWNGHLPVFDHPITLPEFKKYSREELHDRQNFC